MAMGPSLGLFFNVPSIMIVFGGTIAATMIRFSKKESISAFGMSFSVMKVNSEIEEINHTFYANGVRMLVDDYALPLVTQTLKEKNK